MNYSIKGITPVTMAVTKSSLQLDERFSETNTSTDLLGDVYRTEVEVVDDDGVPLYLTFLCGARSGVILEQSDNNYNAIETAPDILESDLKDTIQLDFPRLLNRNFSIATAKLAEEYLTNSKNKPKMERKGHSLAIVISEEVVIHLTQRDIEYYASLNNKENT